MSQGPLWSRRIGPPIHSTGQEWGQWSPRNPRNHSEEGGAQGASFAALVCGPQTWLPCSPTSPAASSSIPSSTWVPSGSSRCSSQTRPSCRASWSSASSQVRAEVPKHREGGEDQPETGTAVQVGRGKVPG